MLFIPSRVIATCFALTSFAAAVAVGLYVGNPPSTVLVRALLVMCVCWAVGLIVAGVAQRAVDSHIDQYKHRHPVPSESTGGEEPDSPPAAEPQPQTLGAGQ